MIITLFAFAAFFLGFGLYSMIKNKRFIGLTFMLLGLMILAVGLIAVYMYPHILPF